MITIIAGEINEGKSTKLQQMYDKDKLGDGFVCKKVFKDNKFYGFNFVRLKTNEQLPFMIRLEYYKNEPEFDEIFFAYRYSKNALLKVYNEVLEMINNNISPIYLDEIGRLEIKHQGLHETFKKILESNLDANIAVRTPFVNDVINHYQIKEYRIVGVKNEQL